MISNKIIPYNPILRQRARELRRNSTLGEILLWKEIRKRKLGVQFHRQVPIAEFIIDFYCHELFLALEVDGVSDYTHEQQLKDLNKDFCLKQLGITIVRISDSDVKFKRDNVVRFLQSYVDKLRFE
jgi:very-short-patch-repair endonuclease